jgi:hypothetical protein
VVHENRIQGFAQIRCPHAVCDTSVCWVGLEEVALLRDAVANSNIIVDIGLTSVDNANISTFLNVSFSVRFRIM